MTRDPAELVLLSGGSEVVSIALAEAAWRAGMSYAVVSLVPHSVLRDAEGCAEFLDVSAAMDDPAKAGSCLLGALQAISTAGRVALLPTEDDGLHLLHSIRSRLPHGMEYSRCRALQMGGLDKAELFEFLAGTDCSDSIAPTLRIRAMEDFERAVDAFGADVVFKPASKPWRRTLTTEGLKVITRENGMTVADVKDALSEVFALSPWWVAQQRLGSLGLGERSACIVRSSTIVGVQVLERAKYPQMGGSAAWVSTSPDSSLLPLAGRIADATGLIGVGELSFLVDSEGKPRLLELNTRPWLQFELLQKSGFPVLEHTVAALMGRPLAPATFQVRHRQWIQPERLLLAWWAGSLGGRLASLGRLIRVLLSRPVIAVYGSSLPRIRRRWVARAFGRARRFFPKRK